MKKILDFLRRNIFTFAMVGAVFVITAILASFLFIQSIKQLKITAESRIELQISALVAHAKEKYSGGVTTLRSLQGFFAGSEKVTRKEFYDFIKTSNFFNTYPGFSGFAYIKRVYENERENFLAEVRSDTSVRKEGYPSFVITPEGKRNEYWPIAYISPEDELGFLLGSDQYAEAVRAENISRARDLGDVSLSTTVQLRQGGDGILIAVPLYKGGSVPESNDDRRRLFEGAVTISLRIDDFFEDILAPYEFEKQSTSIAITGRSNKLIPLLTFGIPNDFLTRLFGIIETTKTIELETSGIKIIFKSPVKNQLTFRETAEPFELMLIFFSAALFMSIIIVISQKVKLTTDLKNRYAFISTLSHQLRTPITNLRWVIESQDVLEKEKKIQQILMKSVLVLNSITERMLLYIEMTEGSIIFNKKKISIEALYEKILHTVSEMRDISRIERVGDKKIAKNVFVDENRIAMAVSYIIENALIYSPENKKVNIGLTVNDRTIDIAVTDYGYGIPENEQRKIFSEFFRASNASLGINYGSGVSNFIAKKIIEMHDGTIQFASKEGEGSVFIVKIPFALE